MATKVSIPALIQALGGKENLAQATHCATRLRVTTRDKSKIDEAALKAIPGVLGVVNNGTQTQIIIGAEVNNVYKDFIAQAGVDEVIAGVLPDGKESVIRELKKKGKVAMVGDGINDAPALTRADIGIAIGAGTDIAIDAADVVLMKSRLKDVPAAIRLSRQTLKNIKENLFWAFIYNIIGIPLAAGVWIHLTGWQLNPMFGAAAMSLSSVCVVSNALRLNLFKMYSTRKDKKMKHAITGSVLSSIEEDTDKKQNLKEVSGMQKTIKIEGMMCGHCEATVKKALEALDGVEEAVVSHEAGTAELKLSADVADDVLTKAVEEKDFKVVSVQ